jgi:hypothetical protein
VGTSASCVGYISSPWSVLEMSNPS